MTADQFQEQYREFRTPVRSRAIQQSMRIKLSDVPDRVVPVKIGNEYCLMIESAARAPELADMVEVVDPAEITEFPRRAGA